LLRITSRDPAPPSPAYARASGGMFRDMTIHDFDMARFLVGREVETVYAAAACLVDPAIGAAGDVDTALVTLVFEGGALGCIDNSRRAVFGYDQRAEVFGSQGMAHNANRYTDGVVVAGPLRVERGLPQNFFMDRYTRSFEREIEAFVAALREGTAPPVTGADGRAALVLALAAERSWREGRPVAVSEIRAQA
jgi:myo-inositol 2-dehydrogenase / D-chiro-inositol 1-dehydrogenase